ncbi:MAG: FapA family protein [bacterium]|nr:FapA family protein [bacterium]
MEESVEKTAAGGVENVAPQQGQAKGAAPGAKPTAGAPPKKDASAPVNFLVWNGQKLPCLVRAAVFQNGLAAGIGIKSQDDAFMAGLLRDPDAANHIRDLIRQQVDVELSRREISSGINQEEILGAIDDFVKAVLTGTGMMGTRKIAEGQPVQPGVDGKLVYVLNANGEPLHRMMLFDRKMAAGKMHRVKPGDVLVERHPPEAGTEGSDVRGETIPVSAPRDISLDKVKGPNCDIKGDKIVAAILGVYREDDQGRVQIVQEVQADEVNASTGNLPRTGVATSNFWIKRGVRQGLAVLTTGDILVGQVNEPASIDKSSKVNARHLIVNGPVIGGGCRRNIWTAKQMPWMKALKTKSNWRWSSPRLKFRGPLSPETCRAAMFRPNAS